MTDSNRATGGAPIPSGSELRDLDSDEIAALAARYLAQRQIAIAESCTAGRVATALACVEGAVDFFRGGLVAYQESIKRRLLDVTAESVFSREAVAEMAAGVARLLDADVAVATSGLAGDDPIDGVEPGTVFIGTLVDADARTSVVVIDAPPDEVCEQATRAALVALLRHLSDVVTLPA